MDNDTEFMECECCGYETMCEEYKGFPRSLWLCKICSGTMISQVMRNPLAYPNTDLLTLKTIAYIKNMLSDEINELNNILKT